MVWSCLVSILPGMAQTEKLTDYVNPFVGTDGYGNVYPGAQIPFGGIQISPDTDSRFYDAASGYKYNHLTLMGSSFISPVPGINRKSPKSGIPVPLKSIVRVTHMIRSGRPPIIMLWNWQTMESKPK